MVQSPVTAISRPTAKLLYYSPLPESNFGGIVSVVQWRYRRRYRRNWPKYDGELPGRIDVQQASPVTVSQCGPDYAGLRPGAATVPCSLWNSIALRPNTASWSTCESRAMRRYDKSRQVASPCRVVSTGQSLPKISRCGLNSSSDIRHVAGRCQGCSTLPSCHH